MAILAMVVRGSPDAGLVDRNRCHLTTARRRGVPPQDDGREPATGGACIGRRIGPTVVTACLASAAVMLPAGASAQDPGPAWKAVQPPRLATVYVLDDRDVETTGTFLRWDATSLAILVDGRERQFDAPRVKRVARRGDGLRNGLVRGALAGVGFGLLADCYNHGQPCQPRRRASLIALAVGFWAGIGVGIDALHTGRTVLYTAPVTGVGSKR